MPEHIDWNDKQGQDHAGDDGGDQGVDAGFGVQDCVWGGGRFEPGFRGAE
jgi:hypothetical protein